MLRKVILNKTSRQVNRKNNKNFIIYFRKPKKSSFYYLFVVIELCVELTALFILEPQTENPWLYVEYNIRHCMFHISWILCSTFITQSSKIRSSLYTRKCFYNVQVNICFIINFCSAVEDYLQNLAGLIFILSGVCQLWVP